MVFADISNTDTSTICTAIQEHYSACDVSDALLKLGVTAAGFLPDIGSICDGGRQGRRLVAPISTAVLVPKSWPGDEATTDDSLSHIPRNSNISPGRNWTDMPAPGTVVLVQQPRAHISAILGDIMVTRLQKRGVLGVVADGRIRDVESCRRVCEDSAFQVWSRGFSAVGPSLEAKPWAVDVLLRVGGVQVSPGDILCADEDDGVIVVIPRDRLQEVCELLPVLKEASQGVAEDVENGLGLVEAVKRNPDFYSNYK